MKFVDKIKNYFCDEEDEEAVKKNAPVKTEPSLLRPKSDISEGKKGNDGIENVNLDAVSERELFKSDPTFNFPIIFDDEDFKEEKLNKSRINTIHREQTKVVERVVETKIFKPSPNISPIYGIINNDDSKVGVNAKNPNDNLLNLYDDNKKVNIDDVLGKVYEQKRTEVKYDNYTNMKDESPLDLFKNIEVDTKDEIKTRIEVTKESIKSVDEKLKTIDELLDNTDDEDFYSLVDSMYKDEEEEKDK